MNDLYFVAIIAGIGGIVIGFLVGYHEPKQPTLRLCSCGRISAMLIDADCAPRLENSTEPCRHEVQP